MKEDIFSPGHDYKVSFGSYEVSMSHWIDQPYLIREHDNTCLFSLTDDGWSSWTVRWVDQSILELDLRKYPGLLSCAVVLDMATNEAAATSGNSSIAGDFQAVSDWVLQLT